MKEKSGNVGLKNGQEWEMKLLCPAYTERAGDLNVNWQHIRLKESKEWKCWIKEWPRVRN